MKTVTLEPTLDGYKAMLRELERANHPDAQETIAELKAYIKQEEG